MARTYLHLVYNVIEVTPFVLAFYDHSRLIYECCGPASLAEAAVAITGYLHMRAWSLGASACAYSSFAFGGAHGVSETVRAFANWADREG